MRDVGSTRYMLALLPPCPTITVLSYSNYQRSTRSISKWIPRNWALVRVSICMQKFVHTHLPPSFSAESRYTMVLLQHAPRKSPYSSPSFWMLPRLLITTLSPNSHLYPPSSQFLSNISLHCRGAPTRPREKSVTASRNSWIKCPVNTALVSLVWFELFNNTWSQ